MARPATRLLRLAAYSALTLVASAGLLLTGLGLVAATGPGAEAVGRLVVGALDGALQGRFTIEGLVIRPDGVVELRGFRAETPEGRTALAVARVVVRLEQLSVTRRELGAGLLLEGPDVTIEPEEDGRLSIARVFSPRSTEAAAPRAAGDPLAGWSFRFPSVALRDGAVTWRSRSGAVLARANRLELSGAGGFGWARADGQLRLGGMMETPLAGPLEVDLDAILAAGRLTVRRIGLTARGSRIDALGWWRPEDDAFRVAVTRLELARADGAGLAPRAAPGADLGGLLYAESDGKRLTAAAQIAPAGARGEGGGRAALAVRFDGRAVPALAFDVSLDRLDPAMLLARAPPGRITVVARGGAAGPPAGWLGGGGGRLEVQRLEARLDGLTAAGTLRWRPAGDVAGELSIDLTDVAAARRALAEALPASLPELAGLLTARATLSGTAAAPRLELLAQAPRLAIDGAELEALRLEASHDAEGDGLTLHGTAPRYEREPIGLVARLRRGSPGAPSTLTELSLTWPGRHWTLAAPAQVTLAPLAVDRLALQDGAQRLELSGGRRAGGRVEARLVAGGVELSALPRRLLPERVDLGGTVELDVRLTGPEAHPSASATFDLHGARALGLTGLRLRGRAGWDGERGLASADLDLARDGGGTVKLAGQLPLPLASAQGTAPVEARLAAEGVAIEQLWTALGVSSTISGQASLRAELGGTIEAPRLAAQAAVASLRAGELPPCDLDLKLDVDGASARGQIQLRRDQSPLASATATIGIERAALLRHTVEALTAAAAAPWHASVEVPEGPVDWLAGKGVVPATLAGRLSGRAELEGSPRAPRGTARLSLRQGGFGLHRDLSLDAEAGLEHGRVTSTGRLAAEAGGKVEWSAALEIPLERLVQPGALEGAPLRLDVTARDVDLAEGLGPRRELTGRVSAALAIQGSLAAPRAELSFDGNGFAVGQVPIGELRGGGRLEPGRASMSADLATARGGTLHAEGSVAATIGVRTGLDELLRAPLAVRARAEALDLGALPAFLPRLVPAAQGTLDAELAVSGSLERPRFTGRARTEGTRLTVAEFGTYTGITLDATLDPQAIRVERFAAERGSGRMEGRLALVRGAAEEARIEGEVRLAEFTLGRSGVDYVTLDAKLRLGGTLVPSRLDLDVEAPDGARLLLPRKSPRSLQGTERRKDVIIGEARPAAPAAGAEGAPPGAPRNFEARIHVRSESVVVRSDQPRLLVEARTDSTWNLVDGALRADGTIDVIHGTVEPMSGRMFKLQRGHVGFAGGPLGEGQLDVAAEYDNPSAKVTVTVLGTLANPQLRLTSTPPLDEASIAMLIATGRTEQTLGGSGSTSTSSVASSTAPGTFTAQDAGMAAAMAVANKAFQDKLGDKMPLDTLTLDSSSVTAGKYVTDRILVSYLRRFDARPDRGENTDEVRVQYQMSRRWTLETRYGNAGAGGASVLWQTDY